VPSHPDVLTHFRKPLMAGRLAMRAGSVARIVGAIAT
jgi:hypothetical protein